MKTAEHTFHDTSGRKSCWMLREGRLDKDHGPLLLCGVGAVTDATAIGLLVAGEIPNFTLRHCKKHGRISARDGAHGRRRAIIHMYRPYHQWRCMQNAFKIPGFNMTDG